MMSTTLNDLVQAAILGGEASEELAPVDVTPEPEKTASAALPDLSFDVEKVASALEFLGTRGVENIVSSSLQKLAMCNKCGKGSAKGSKKCPHCGAMAKKASGHGMAGYGNVGTNAGQMHAEHTQKQVGPHSGAPSMKQSKDGPTETNMSKKPGGGKEVDTSSTGHGTHHPALASNESAIDYDKREKSKKVLPALSAVLDEKAYADPKLKENLSNASGKGDKNIKTAHDLDAIRAELERRVAAGGH